jgi:hypothetical protein
MRSALKALRRGQLDISEEDVRKIGSIIIMIIVVAVAVNLVWGFSNYILGTINGSAGIAIVPLIGESDVKLSATAFTILVIMIIVTVIGAMIAVFLRLGRGAGATTT